MTERKPIDPRASEPKKAAAPAPDPAVSQDFAYVPHHQSEHECTDACLPGSGDVDSFGPDTSGFNHLHERSTRQSSTSRPPILHS
jgi:hypothetical protein